MKVRQIVAPASAPISTEEAKVHIRVDGTVDDDYIASLIGSATDLAECYTGRAFITQTLELYLDSFPAAVIRLRRPRLQSVVSVSYLDVAGDTQVLDPSSYAVDDKDEPGTITPVYSFPSTTSAPNAVIIRYVAGYGTASEVPGPIRTALLLSVARAYLYREDLTLGANLARLAPYRVSFL